MELWINRVRINSSRPVISKSSTHVSNESNLISISHDDLNLLRFVKYQKGVVVDKIEIYLKKSISFWLKRIDTYICYYVYVVTYIADQKVLELIIGHWPPPKPGVGSLATRRFKLISCMQFIKFTENLRKLQ